VKVHGSIWFRVIFFTAVANESTCDNVPVKDVKSILKRHCMLLLMMFVILKCQNSQKTELSQLVYNTHS